MILRTRRGCVTVNLADFHFRDDIVIFQWTLEPLDLEHLVEMSRRAFQANIAESPDYTVPLEYIATVASLPYQREGKKLFDLDTAICLHTIALLEIKRDSFLNLQRRRKLLQEVGSLLDDRWKLKGEERDGYAADEADLERGQIESILPLLGDGSVPLEQCGPFGVCTTYTSHVTGETRMVSRFRIVFRRSLKEGEEWEESDVWSSSVPEASSDEGDGEVHSGNDLMRRETFPRWMNRLIIWQIHGTRSKKLLSMVRRAKKG